MAATPEAARTEAPAAVLLKPWEPDDDDRADVYAAEEYLVHDGNVLLQAFPELGWRRAGGDGSGDWAAPAPALQALFISAVRPAQDAGGRTAFQSADVLTSRLDFDSLQAIVTVLHELGAFGDKYRSLEHWEKELETCLSKATVEQLAVFQLGGDQITDSEPFDDEEATDAEVGTAGPASCRYLFLSSWASFHEPADKLPMRALARLHCALGSRDRRALRAAEGSSVATAASLLRSAMGGYRKELSSADDAVLARALPAFVRDSELPSLLRSHGFTEEEMLKDLLDGAALTDGALRPQIEERRLVQATIRLPTLAKLVETCESWQEASSLVGETLERLIPSHSGSLHVGYRKLDSALQERAPFLDELAAQGLPARSICEALWADADGMLRSSSGLTTRISLLGNNSAPSPSALSPPAGGDQSNACGLRDHELRKAFHAAEFRGAVAASEGLQGVELLAQAFGSGCTIIVRFLLAPAPWLKERHAYLGRLAMALHDRRAYFAQVLTMDPETGRVPDHLLTYQYDRKQTDLLLRLDFQNMDMVNSPGGFLGLRELENATTFTHVPANRHYTEELCLRGIASFLGRLLDAIGFDQDVPESEGFNLERLFQVQLDFVLAGAALPAQERVRWLQRADTEFRRALGAVSEIAWARLNSASPSSPEARLRALLPPENPYVLLLSSHRKHAQSLVSFRQTFPSMFASAPVSLLNPAGLPQGKRPATTTADDAQTPAQPQKRPKSKAARRAAARPSAASGQSVSRQPRGGGSRSAASSQTRGSSSSRPPSQQQPNSGSGPTPDQPGAKSHLTKTLASGQLHLAGFVYDIDKIAAHCSVAADAKCWPVLLSNKKGAAALALCPNHSSHGGLSSSFHSSPPGWDRADICKRFSNRATPAQNREAGWQPSSTSAAKRGTP